MIVKMVKTKVALKYSIISAVIIGIVYYISNKYIFNNVALWASNVKMVGIIMVVTTFLVAFVGMKWKDWFK